MGVSRADLIEFLSEELAVDVSDVVDSTLLFSSGMIDSFALVDLIFFLEEHGGFRVNALDVTLDNLDSVERILAFAERSASG